MAVDFFTHPIFLSCFIAVIAAQTLKAIFAWWRHGQFHWRYLFLSAGMPSSHTAAVTALSVSVFMTEGVSTTFVAVLILSMIIVRDVIGDKNFARQQEELVNETFRQISEGNFDKIKWDDLIGHTVKEVVVGFVLGLVVAASVFGA